MGQLKIVNIPVQTLINRLLKKVNELEREPLSILTKIV